MGDYARYPSLSGRPVFITGGATGIGAAMVRAFAEQGALVGYVDLVDEEAAMLGATIEAGGCPRPFYRRVDVTAVESLQAAIREFAEISGGMSTSIPTPRRSVQRKFV